MNFLEDDKYLWVVIVWVFLISITHYSAFLLLVAGAITCVIVYSRREALSLKSLSNHKRLSILLFILILGSGYLLYHFLNLIQLDKLSTLLDQTRLISENTDYIYSFGLTLQNFGLLIYLMAIVGCFVSVKKNKKTLIYLFLWLVIAILMIFLQKIILGASILTIMNLFYFLSIPLCLLAGVGIAYAYEKIDSELRFNGINTGKSNIVQLSGKFLLLTLLFCCFFAGYQQSALVNPKVVMVTPEDIKAYQWIESNTSGNAKFLINSFEWGYEYKPVDGGGWINAFTQRPVFFFSGNVDFTSMKEFIDEKKIEYVYLGHGLRAISSDWFHDDCLVFQEDNIKIYGVNQQNCYQN